MNTIIQSFNLYKDDELIRKIVMGESALFEILIRRYNALLYKMARAYGFNHQDAEDLMQETHYSAYTSLGTFRFEASYKTWVTKILLHKCYHKMSGSRNKPEEVNSDLILKDDSSGQTPVSKSDTQKTVINRELAAILEQSLQQIPLAYRSVFVLREIEGFSTEETSNLLDISMVNVKVRLNRARTMLQKQLEKFYTASELYEFHLMYCDRMVSKVFAQISDAKMYKS